MFAAAGGASLALQNKQVQKFTGYKPANGNPQQQNSGPSAAWIRDQRAQESNSTDNSNETAQKPSKNPTVTINPNDLIFSPLDLTATNNPMPVDTNNSLSLTQDNAAAMPVIPSETNTPAQSPKNITTKIVFNDDKTATKIFLNNEQKIITETITLDKKSATIQLFDNSGNLVTTINVQSLYPRMVKVVEKNIITNKKRQYTVQQSLPGYLKSKANEYIKNL